jgi:hypothetical protein
MRSSADSSLRKTSLRTNRDQPFRRRKRGRISVSLPLAAVNLDMSVSMGGKIQAIAAHGQGEFLRIAEKEFTLLAKRDGEARESLTALVMGRGCMQNYLI